MLDQVILVDSQDKAIGTAEKLKAHEEGKLHRAFSIFVFNSKNELLLQQRAKSKYHSGGLWTNTCCSHPNPIEPIEKTIHDRLQFEMGFDSELKHLFAFEYRAEFENGLIEHEYDHVFLGNYENNPNPNPDEVEDYKWISWSDLQTDLKQNPSKYTAWLHILMDRYFDKFM